MLDIRKRRRVGERDPDVGRGFRLLADDARFFGRILNKQVPFPTNH